MKKIILLPFICLLLGNYAISQTTYTSPNTTTTVTVTNAAGWHALAWTPAWNAGDPQPWTYVIQPNFTILVGPGGGNTVNLTGEANLTLTVQGKLGFYNGNNDLQLAATATVNIAAGGEIGYVSGGGCCTGNSSNNLVIGATNMSGPFSFVGPDQAVQGTPLTYSTHWLTNAGSADWSTAGNWSNGVPSSTKNAFITDATTFDPIITVNNAAVSRLVVLANGLLTINSGGVITTNDDVENSGTITVKSGGSFIQTAASGLTNTGVFNVERAIPGGVSFISSPINNAGVNSFGITTTGTNGGQVLTHQTTPCSSTMVDPTSPYGNLMEMHEDAALLTPAANCAQELWFVKSAGTLTNGRGYSLTNGATTLNFTGTVNNGVVSYAGLTRQGGNINNAVPPVMTRGWHLVGNPYPSPIQLNTDDLLAMGFDAQIHLYNHNGAYTGTWVSYPPTTAVTIPVGQSFQIRSTAGAGNFSLNNTFRGGLGTTTFYKILANDFLKISLNNGIKTDTTNVFFTAGATDNFDPAFDANRMSDAIQHPMIYSLANGEALSYNALQPMNPSEVKAVPLGVRTEVHGAHSLTFTGINTLTATVTLEDLKLNVTQPVVEGYVYPFTTVSGDSQERFILHFTADATTGIATVKNNSVKLFPNPASGTTTLILSKDHGYNKAEITDVCGKTIQEFQLSENDNTKTLSLEGLYSGVYFIKLSGTADANVLKLIKK